VSGGPDQSHFKIPGGLDWTSRHCLKFLEVRTEPPGVYIFIFDNAFGMFSWCNG